MLTGYLVMPVSRCLSPNMRSARLEWPSRDLWSWNTVSTRLASLCKKIESLRQMLARLRTRKPKSGRRADRIEWYLYEVQVVSAK